MSPPNQVGENQKYQPFDTLIPPILRTARNSDGAGGKAKLRVADAYLPNEGDTLTGLVNIQKTVRTKPNPRSDSLKWYVTEGTLIAGGTTLLATNWDSEGWRALGGWMVWTGVTGLALEVLEDTEVWVKLPAKFKIGASVLYGLTGSMMVLTIGGFKPGVDPNSGEFPVDEYGERKNHVRTGPDYQANTVSN